MEGQTFMLGFTIVVAVIATILAFVKTKAKHNH
jgi:hypothetical protein